MNKLFIIGNLCSNPELRSTRDGIEVCTFSVAVNRRKRGAQAGQDADFFRVSAWRELGKNCHLYLKKGRKVAVVGEVTVSTYTGNDGKTHATLEVTANDVEFLTPRNAEGEQAAPAPQENGGYIQVDDVELPF